jgi:hypothetical protein
LILTYSVGLKMKTQKRAGRPAKLRRQLVQRVEIVHPGTGQKMLGTVEDAVVLALIAKARRGNVCAIRLILDSLYGRRKSHAVQ